MKTLKTISLSALILLGASSNLVAKKTDHDKVKINEEAFNSLITMCHVLSAIINRL